MKGQQVLHRSDLIKRPLPALRAFGNMAGAGDRPADGPGPQSYAQPINAGGKRGAVLFGCGIEIGLRKAERLAPAGAHLHRLDPEPGLDIIEPGGKQADDVASLAGGGGEFDAALQHFAIDPPQYQFKPPRALRPRLERAHHVGGQIAHHPIEQACGGGSAPSTGAAPSA